MTSIHKRGKSSVGVAFLAAMAPAVANGNVVISSAATQNMSCTSGICAPTAPKAVLNVTDLENLLTSGNIEVTTTGSGVQANTIEADAPLTWSSGNSLSLNAYESIRVERTVTVSGTGGVSVVTSDGARNGMFSFGPKGQMSFADTSSDLTINGLRYTLVATLPVLASAIAANPSGAYALAEDYDAAHDGKYHIAAITTTFEGTFNGLGNTISNLEVAGSAAEEAFGLFSELDTPSSVSSLRMIHANIDAGGKLSAAGTIAGFSKGTVFNSEVEGTLRAKRAPVGAYGGAVGSNDGVMQDVASSVVIVMGPGSSDEAFVGGLVGANENTIEESFATGSITVTGTAVNTNFGGLLGLNDGDTENSYATGSSTAEGDSGYAVVGGLIGSNTMNLASSYSTGGPAADGSRNYIGGLIGYDAGGEDGGSVTDTYWDTTTSGITNLSQGAGNIANDPGIKGKATQQLESKLPHGFDPRIWAEDPKINGGVPYLIANPPSK